jgi:filamentous hemagglutinin family protein
MKQVITQLWVASSIALGCLVTVNPVRAQIVPDNTLPVNSRVTPGCTDCTIDGGTVRSVNLFHSFSEFSVPTGGEAFFNNGLRIQNIFSRVTGNSASSIDGLLRTNGTASLFFLNPNGIIFGPNAQLNIGGSFFASTASSFKFPGGSEFSATNPQAPPLLRINVAPGLQWGNSQPGATISNTGNLTSQQDLILVADKLDLQGQLRAGRELTLFAQDTVRVRDSIANPFIASSGGTLLVQGNQRVDIFALNHPESGFFSGGDMVLRSANPVGGDAHYWSGGNFRIEHIDGTLGTLSSPHDPIIATAGDVALGRYIGASLHILAGGQVRILGNIDITGVDNTGTSVGLNGTAPFNNPAFRTITLSDGITVIAIDGSTQPTLDIRAGIDWNSLPGGVPGNINLFTTTNPNPIFRGNASSANIQITGSITISQPNGLVFISNQFQPNPLLTGGIQVGLIDNSSFTDSGGDILIDARNSIVTNSAILAHGINKGGNVKIIANDSINIRGDISTTARVGQAGDVLIRSRASVSNLPAIQLIDAGIDAASFGSRGKSGNVTIEATNQGAIELLGIAFRPKIYSDTFADDARFQDTKTGGDIKIIGGNINIQNYEFVADVKPNSVGNGGNVFLSGDSITLEDSLIQANTDGAGNAGNISIAGKSITIRTVNDYSLVRTNTSGSGNAGNISLRATQGDIKVLGSALLFSNTVGQGNGGNVYIQADKGNIQLDDVLLIANTDVRGNAGNINLQAPNGDISLGNSSTVSSTTYGEGIAGAIELTSKNLILRDGSDISTSAEASASANARAGSISIHADIIDLSGVSFFGGQASSLSVETQGLAEAGSLQIMPNTSNELKIKLNDNAQITAATTSSGNSGNLQITAPASITVSGQGQISVGTSGNGRAGNMQIISPVLSLEDGVQVSASTNSTNLAAIGGNLTVQASQLNLLGGSKLLAGTTGTASGGSVTIQPYANEQTLDINFQDESTLSASTTGSGLGGSLTVSAPESVTLRGNGTVSATTSSDGQAGTVTINTPTLAIDRTQVSTSTSSSGNGGDLTVIAPNSVTLSSGGKLSAETDSSGQAGNVAITTSTLNVNSGARVSTTTTSTDNAAGKGGNITVSANTLNLAGTDSGLFAETQGAANAGNLTLQTNGSDNLQVNFVTPGSKISASTSGSGQGGNLLITAPQAVTLTGNGQLSAQTSSTGQAGSVSIDTRQFTVEKGAQVSASTSDTGQGGSLSVKAADFVTVSGEDSRLSTEATGTGNAGSLTINTPQLTLEDSAKVSAEATEAGGNAGEVSLNTRELTLQNEAQVLASNVSGTSKDIRLEGLDTLTLSNNSKVSTSTQIGQAGSLSVNANNNPATSVQLDGNSSLSAQATGAGGNAGSVTINTRQLNLDNQSDISSSNLSGISKDITLQGLDTLVVNNSEISASTETGTAGSLSVNAADSVQLSGILANGKPAGLSVEATSGGTAGNLTLETEQMSVRNGAQVTVSSPKGQAGNLTITANSLLLDRGSLSAETGKSSAEGGANITLNGLDFLLLENESLISAKALNAANGGNINIESRFLLGLPAVGFNGSDIIANAVQGNGGTIQIQAAGIFGLNEQIAIPGNRTNDIDASSEFGAAGDVTLNTLINPTQGLTQLPIELVDLSDQIAQVCAARGDNESKFIVTGRGGLPSNPSELLSPDMVQDDFGTLISGTQSRTDATSSPRPTNSSKQLVEAQGWIIDANGTISLVAQAPTVTPHNPALAPPPCQESKK